jgi:hypothetical protein
MSEAIIPAWPIYTAAANVFEFICTYFGLLYLGSFA